MGYRYNGESHCRGCGATILWFVSPNKKNMPFNVIPGTENEDPQKLECHFGRCTSAAQFRQPRGNKKT